MSEYAGEKSYLFQCDIVRYAQRQEKRNKKGQEHLWQKTGKDTDTIFRLFYNGEEEQPEVQELKLSDAFEKPTDEPNLELKCKVYNINDGKNKAIMESCGWLNDYMTFVNKVREYHADGAFDDLAIDIEKAIDYCIDNDILKEFLKTYRSEVTKSMQLNYEFDRQLELERADAIEEGENKMLFTLVTKGKLDMDTAAEEAGVSVVEFEKLMSEAGYKVPESV